MHKNDVVYMTDDMIEVQQQVVTKFEDILKNRKTQNNQYKSIILFNIDNIIFENTLSLNFHKLSVTGYFYSQMYQTVKTLNPNVIFLGYTSRTINEHDLDTLSKHNIQFDLILSRGSENYLNTSCSQIYICETLEELKNNFGLICLAVVDNNLTRYNEYTQTFYSFFELSAFQEEEDATELIMLMLTLLSSSLYVD